MSLVVSMKLLDEVPVVKRVKSPSKYELVLKKLLISKKPAGSVKAQSSKQANTIASSFRRAVKENGYHVRVMKQGMDIILVNEDLERKSENGDAAHSP